MIPRLHVVSVNQDRGIAPDRRKGAAVHLRSMRRAFDRLGARVSTVDESDGSSVLFQLHAIHRTWPIDVIYERYALGKSAAAEFARAHGIPFALEVNAPLAEEQSRWRGQGDDSSDRKADRTTFGQACFIRAVSSAVAEYAAARGGSEDAILVCPNGIDTSLFTYSLRPASRHTTLGTPGRFVLGFHGRERPWHGFDRLVELVKALLDRSLPVHLKVIGNGEFQALERLPDDAFTRLSWVDHHQLPAHLADFDAMPLTYSPELPCYFSPLKLMEGMACGVVPVVPDLGDLPDMVQHGRNGLVYSAGQDDSLLQALLSLISNAPLCQRLASNAAQTAQAHDWTRIAQTVLDHASAAPHPAATQQVRLQ